MSARLDIKYRPASFDDVVGQAAVVGRLKVLVANPGSCQAFLFSGPPGVGKTTLARIVGRALLGCDDAYYLQEVDGATHTGIDAMRGVRPSMGGFFSPRVVIVDECHRLSGPAWDSLLKPIEEPPPGAAWLFCTTIPGKVPETVKSRCQMFELGPVGNADLGDLVDRVCKSERIELSAGERARLIASAKGSPRTALHKLQLHVVPLSPHIVKPRARKTKRTKKAA